jgi:hypothetical protein
MKSLGNIRKCECEKLGVLLVLFGIYLGGFSNLKLHSNLNLNRRGV